MGTFLVAHDDRCASETYTCAIGHSRHQAGLQVAGLSAVCLVHQHHNALIGVQYFEGLVDLVDRAIFGNLVFGGCVGNYFLARGRIAFQFIIAVLLDSGEDQTWSLTPDQCLHAR